MRKIINTTTPGKFKMEETLVIAATGKEIIFTLEVFDTRQAANVEAGERIRRQPNLICMGLDTHMVNDKEYFNPTFNCFE